MLHSTESMGAPLDYFSRRQGCGGEVMDELGAGSNPGRPKLQVCPS